MMFDQIGNDFERLQGELLRSPITPSVTPEEIRRHLEGQYDFDKPVALDELVADVEKMLRTWQVQVTHPRYFGLFNPSVQLASVIADTIVAMYNPQLASWRTSPAANELEWHTLSWFIAKFGLPPHSLATFTNGGSEANHSAVIVALTRAFPGYGENGIRGVKAQPIIYVTDQSHHSFGKIAHMTGMGRSAVRVVRTDDHLKLDLADLEQKVAADRENGFIPFMVVGTAGTTAAGAIDPLKEIGHLCRESGLWFHVDAAWGGAAIISPNLRIHLAGIENADSITCDAHKWFSVPMGCGMFFCRHAESVIEAFRSETPYMPGKVAGTALDPYATTMQWSRRFIGLKLFMALAHNGQAGQAEMIEHQATMGDLLREALIASGWQIMNSTPLPLVCFTRSGLDVTQFVNSLLQQQIAWISATALRGVPVARACITSFKTTASDIYSVVEKMNELAAERSEVKVTSA
jgi:aromatic-L-amino-acid decarboxylase